MKFQKDVVEILQDRFEYQNLDAQFLNEITKWHSTEGNFCQHRLVLNTSNENQLLQVCLWFLGSPCGARNKAWQIHPHHQILYCFKKYDSYLFLRRTLTVFPQNDYIFGVKSMGQK